MTATFEPEQENSESLPDKRLNVYFDKRYLSIEKIAGIVTPQLNPFKPLYSKTVVLDTTKPTLFNFDYLGVDAVNYLDTRLFPRRRRSLMVKGAMLLHLYFYTGVIAKNTLVDGVRSPILTPPNPYTKLEPVAAPSSSLRTANLVDSHTDAAFTKTILYSV